MVLIAIDLICIRKFAVRRASQYNFKTIIIMKKSILLAALAVAIFAAPTTFAQGGKPQGPKEKATGVEKKEMKKEQKVADNSKKHHHKKAKKEA